MSMDVLQDKIRKTKNPSVLYLDGTQDWIPPQYAQQEGEGVLGAYYSALLRELKGVIPAVRFSFGCFALMGADGVGTLSNLLRQAKELGYYVILDMPELLSAAAAEQAARMLGTEDSCYPCDGVVLPMYAGSDLVKPFIKLAAAGKAVFPVVRTANRSASELQDLLSGNRLVHVAAADIISRLGESRVGKFGYSQVGALAAASAADSLRNLRTKYARLFLLLDGADYPNANAKNCSYAFDKLGRGAAACIGSAVVGAWKETAGEDCLAAAVQAAERMKKNLTRYITVL